MARWNPTGRPVGPEETTLRAAYFDMESDPLADGACVTLVTDDESPPDWPPRFITPTAAAKRQLEAADRVLGSRAVSLLLAVAYPVATWDGESRSVVLDGTEWLVDLNQDDWKPAAEAQLNIRSDTGALVVRVRRIGGGTWQLERVTTEVNET